MSDYWIGDTVRIISSGKTGKFEGVINGNAKVKIGKKLLLVPLSDVKKLEEDEPEISVLVDNLDSEVSSKIFMSFSDILDLHIEKLNPKMINEIPALLINYQIKMAKEYIKEAIRRKQLSVTIIHGKGTGVLKMEIQHLLKSFQEVYFTKSVNDGGAIEVTFSYSL